MNIVSLIKNIPGVYIANGIDANSIIECEKKLNVSFSDEYKCYLKEIGLACFDGVELTGITQIKRLNVVSVTEYEREANPFVPSNYYVIEQTNIDSIVIWQNEKGEIFQSQPKKFFSKIFNSLEEYICSFLIS